MSQSREQVLRIFDGFNGSNADELMTGLMRLFSTISSARPHVRNEMEDVAAILRTAEFIEAAQPEHKKKVDVIKGACVAKLLTSVPYNEWAETLLINGGYARRD